MAKTYSLSLPDDEAHQFDQLAEKKGITSHQLLRQLIRDYQQSKSPPVSRQQPLAPSELKQLAEQMQQMKAQLDGMQQFFQKAQLEPIQLGQPLRAAMQPVSNHLQQMETRIVKLCEALDKLTGVLESDRVLLLQGNKHQEAFLGALYVLTEKTLLYTSPEEYRQENQRLMDEMYARLEHLLQEA